MKLIIVLVSLLVLSTNATAQQIARNVSEDETKSFLSKFEAVSAEDAIKWEGYKAQKSGNEQIDGLVVSWVQPANKKEPCKIFDASQPTPGQTSRWDNKENRAYWDGSCKSGYAFGLGREFVQVDGELVSCLADYKEVRTKPLYYLDTYYDRNYVKFSANSPPYYASLAYLLQGQQVKNEVMIRLELNDFAENRVYTQQMWAGGDEVVNLMALQNGNRFLVIRNTNPKSDGYVFGTNNAENEKTGYNVLFTNNGIKTQTRHLFYSTATQFEDVIIPLSYRSYLSDKNNLIIKKLNVANGVLEEAYIAINKYKRRICKGDVKVDFVDSEIYGRICLEGGELSHYEKIISDATERKNERYRTANEGIARQKETLAREQQNAAARQAQVQVQAAQVQSQANRQNTDAVNEFARGMEEFNRSSAQFTQSMLNSVQSPGVQFGNTGSTRTNCIRTANIISCR